MVKHHCVAGTRPLRFWGSCGCDLENIEHHIHKCGLEIGDRCSEYDEKKLVRYMSYVNIDREYNSATEYGWSEWRPCDYAFTIN